MLIDRVRPRCHGRAHDLAISVREAFAVRAIPTDEDLEHVLDGLQIDVVERELPGDFTEVLSERVVVLQPGLPRAERRWLIAHAIGHTLLHAGVQTRIMKEVRWQQERQADLFAGFLLMSLALLATARSAYEAAETFDVPLDRVVHWLGWLAS